jgi:hypothetical protein
VKHFAGLDVSLEETAVCVVDEAGTMVREARVPSEPEALVAFCQGPGLVMGRIGLEACSLRLTKRVLEIVRDEPVCRRLMGVPGVGPLTALAFRATIDQPSRFRRSRDVGAHLGLTPKRYQSGETDVQGGISRCGDELARAALHEAAHPLLIRGRRWSTLRAWGMQQGSRMRSPR